MPALRERSKPQTTSARDQRWPATGSRPLPYRRSSSDGGTKIRRVNALRQRATSAAFAASNKQTTTTSTHIPPGHDETHSRYLSFVCSHIDSCVRCLFAGRSVKHRSAKKHHVSADH